MFGCVKWFDVKKKYGFIEGEDGKDYFVHEAALLRVANLNADEQVSFTPTETEKGLQAQEVKLEVD